MSGVPRTEEGRAAPFPSPALLKTCCADLWAHPAVRVLAGDHLHPGGRALTELALDLLTLPAGTRLLDVGSGPGAAARLAAERGQRVVALDLSPSAAAEAAATPRVVGLRGDAERLPMGEGTVDGALAECVISTIPDKPAAVAEIHRVLRPGSPFVLTDVTRPGRLPARLDSLLGWVACAGGALSLEGYVHLLEDAGFRVQRAEDHRDALVELVAQVRRRLALFQGALGVGLLAKSKLGISVEMLELGQEALGEAATAVESGALSYALVLARA